MSKRDKPTNIVQFPKPYTMSPYRVPGWRPKAPGWRTESPEPELPSPATPSQVAKNKLPAPPTLDLPPATRVNVASNFESVPPTLDPPYPTRANDNPADPRVTALLAVMHDPTRPLKVRMDAAVKIYWVENEPRPRVIIKIPSLPSLH